MQQGTVYYNGTEAGTIWRDDIGKYYFSYADAYYNNPTLPAISLTMPKTTMLYESEVLFPFFYGLLTEGINKDIQCRLLRIDGEDDFSRLLKTAGDDTIGAITIKEA
ncbi:MAG: HipA N-terminal domain-containing protein [Bacteroidota bacterium]